MQNLETISLSRTSSTSCQDSVENSPKSSHSKQPPKEKVFKSPLTFFKTFKNSKNPLKPCKPRAPKKEYLRCKLIRGCKKCMRQLAQIKNLQKIKKLKKTTSKTKQIWEKMLKFYENNLETLEEFSKTDTTLLKEVYKSYNSSFCSKFFENKAVRKIFQLYVESLFIDLNVQNLQKEFNFSCCNAKVHQDSCVAAWKLLKEYVLGKMMEEVSPEEFKKRKPRVKVEKAESIQGFEMFNRSERIEKYVEKVKEVVEDECKISMIELLDLQPKWIQRCYLMDLHII